ncbi:phage tail protein [Novosphingobium huizhouense]|uniref:phage tail protein n=1 Tax=Novosphingobium huizhouense TaxID=2866625 RepID=UPI001CD860CE|nr:phage tail protein [Novosphingobium huizhouense]
MKKPASLRAAIARLLPEVERDYDKLAMWVEKGSVRGRLGNNHGFAWSYDLTVLATGYTDDPTVLFFVVTEWLRDQQPDLLAPGAAPIPFEVDINSATSWDVTITLRLEEFVEALPGTRPGEWQLQVKDQPVPLDPDSVPFAAPPVPVASIWAHGVQIAPAPVD